MNKAAETVRLIRDFIYVLLPLLIPLLASIGGLTTVSLINPALLFAISVLMSLMANLIFPADYVLGNFAPLRRADASAFSG